MTEAKKPSTTRKKAPPKDQMWEGMTVKQFDAAKETFSNAATVLRLRDWSFKLHHFPLDDEDTIAEIDVVFGQKRASIRICREWNDLDADTRQRVALHEMLHVFMDPTLRYLERTLPTLIGEPAKTAVCDAVHEQIEQAVDAIAESFVQVLKG